ncbi:hypothetical protein Halha_2038 [Halobacteroides halobius DSM 5150]|uniref:Hydrogenase maturation protease n=1 Tax=Halobacteroides halobius (strain ATCC 35273 / DSM 5150 / MD-1) TaxID=748449 RepID=L0KAA5_HALHC|nr:hypothetical protein [Halobacteroides halobius]AGB41936.1 hypothetical protein Halha_2038 [Halobacteroides halobius DSM 5150]
MFRKLAVIGIGDTRKQDQGITVYLLDKLKEMFSKYDISFIQINSAGQELCDLLSNIKAEKVLVLDTDRDTVTPGDLDYLKITPKEGETLKELLVVTIGIFSDDWGKKLSNRIAQNLSEILNKVFDVVSGLLS